MKKRLTLLNFILAFTLLYSGKVSAQACSVNIDGNNAVCEGTQQTLTATAYGPETQIMASNTAGNNQRGNMFDITATNAITILSFDASPMGNTTIEIYYKVGTWNGFANTPSAWTFVGSAATPYTGGFSAVDVDVNVTIPAGQTYAFYITSNSTLTSLNYSNGTAVGNVYSADANLTFKEGGGLDYPFTQGTGAVYQPRVWNGNIHYAVAGLPTIYTWGTGETTQSIQPTISASTEFTVAADIAGCPTSHDTLDVAISTPTISIGTDRTVCAGDTVLLDAEGNAVSYSWDNGVTDSVAFVAISSLQYISIATDSIGCTNSDTLMVNVNALPIVSAGTDFSICMHDNITLSGQGATSYSWNNGAQDNVPFEGLSSMQYVVTGTDANNCVDTDTIQVTVNSLPNVYGGGDQEACFGLEFTLSGSGADSYDWTNGITDGVPYIVPMGVNEYVVTGTDLNGCSNSDTVQVTALNNQALIAAIGTTLITSMEIGYDIQWYNCDDQQIVSGQTGFTFTPTVTGHYAAIVTNSNQCTDTSDCILVDFTTLSENEVNLFEVYPNPTSKTITIQSANTTINKVEVLNVLGQVVYETVSGKMKTTIDLSTFEGSQFFVRILSDDKTEVVKVLKY